MNSSRYSGSSTPSGNRYSLSNEDVIRAAFRLATGQEPSDEEVSRSSIHAQELCKGPLGVWVLDLSVDDAPRKCTCGAGDSDE